MEVQLRKKDEFPILCIFRNSEANKAEREGCFCFAFLPTLSMYLRFSGLVSFQAFHGAIWRDAPLKPHLDKLLEGKSAQGPCVDVSYRGKQNGLLFIPHIQSNFKFGQSPVCRAVSIYGVRLYGKKSADRCVLMRDIWCLCSCPHENTFVLFWVKFDLKGFWLYDLQRREWNEINRQCSSVSQGWRMENSGINLSGICCYKAGGSMVWPLSISLEHQNLHLLVLWKPLQKSGASAKWLNCSFSLCSITPSFNLSSSLTHQLLITFAYIPPAISFFVLKPQSWTLLEMAPASLMSPCGNFLSLVLKASLAHGRENTCHLNLFKPHPPPHPPTKLVNIKYSVSHLTVYEQQ